MAGAVSVSTTDVANLTASPTVPDNTFAIRPLSTAGNHIVRDGRPWWFLGYNSFTWSANCGTADERMTESQVDAWFSSMRSDGHGAVRLFFQPRWSLQRLDAAVASARRHGVYVVITLDDALGQCGATKKDAAWFAEQGPRDAYQQHLEAVVSRYRGDPTIAWFEYLNEPGDAGGALRRFYDQMGAVAKRIDPDRLFSSGTIAPYALGGGGRFREVTASPGVDIASLHEYDETEAPSHHLAEVQAESDGKPVIVGEFGIAAGEECKVDFATRAQRIRDKAQAYVGSGTAGAFAWAWQPGGDNKCSFGNLAADAASQDVLRTFTPARTLQTDR